MINSIGILITMTLPMMRDRGGLRLIKQLALFAVPITIKESGLITGCISTDIRKVLSKHTCHYRKKRVSIDKIYCA